MLQSFIPTLLVALLAILIPLILLLIAKKAHTITTLSALHDLIMTRYYKFLIVNVLVFFCVGTAAMQSFLLSFRSTERPNVIQVVADSFPTAGPFYVGWRECFLPISELASHFCPVIFTTAMHGGFELALCKCSLHHQTFLCLTNIHSGSVWRLHALLFISDECLAPPYNVSNDKAPNGSVRALYSYDLHFPLTLALDENELLVYDPVPSISIVSFHPTLVRSGY